MDLRRLMIFSLNCMVCLLVLTVRERVRPQHQYARRRGIWQATMVGNLSTGTNVAEIPPTQAKKGQDLEPGLVSKNDTLQGEPISARIRGTEIPSPWWLRFPAFAAPVAAGLQKADRCPFGCC